MRLATLCLLAAALPGTARADEGESERAFAPVPTYSFAIGNPEGHYFARVLAVNANGVFSARQAASWTARQGVGHHVIT